MSIRQHPNLAELPQLISIVGAEPDTAYVTSKNAVKYLLSKII
jgi:hypothetical protein